MPELRFSRFVRRREIKPHVDRVKARPHTKIGGYDVEQFRIERELLEVAVRTMGVIQRD